MSQVFRALKLRVFTSDLQAHEDYTMHAAPGTAYNQDDMIRLASQFIWSLKEDFPGNEFKLVHKGRNRYNVIPTETIDA